jgi:hypothetical protein
LAEFWTLADWAPYSPDFNLQDFSICSVLQVKVQVMSNANLAALRPSIAMEWDRLVVEYIHKTCRSFHSYHKAVANKNEVQIEAKSPAHQRVLLRPNIQ